MPHIPDEAPLSDKLGIKVPGLKRIFAWGALAVILTYMFISPVVMWLNDLLLVHGRLLHWSEMWLSAQFDAVLAVGIGTLVAMLRGHDIPGYFFPDWLRSWWLHITAMAIPVTVGVLHVISEQGSSPIQAVWMGINWLYHNLVLYLVIGYPSIIMIVAVVWMFIRHGAWREPLMWIGAVVVLACGVSWGLAGDYDGRHQFTPAGISKHELANPGAKYDGVIPQFIRRIIN